MAIGLMRHEPQLSQPCAQPTLADAFRRQVSDDLQIILVPYELEGEAIFGSHGLDTGDEGRDNARAPA